MLYIIIWACKKHIQLSEACGHRICSLLHAYWLMYCVHEVNRGFILAKPRWMRPWTYLDIQYKPKNQLTRNMLAKYQSATKECWLLSALQPGQKGASKKVHIICLLKKRQLLKVCVKHSTHRRERWDQVVKFPPYKGLWQKKENNTVSSSSLTAVALIHLDRLWLKT